MPDKIGIVNFANQKGNYLKMQERLRFSLEKTGYDGNLYFYNHEKHIHQDCPYHCSDNKLLYDQVVPYGFKPWAMQNAIDDGCDIVVWMDAALYATKNIKPIIDNVKGEGYLLFDNIGFTIGDYTSDDCLKYFGWSREKAFQHKMIMACFIGIDTRSPKAMQFFKGYFDAAKDKSPYRGSWNNSNGDVSPDTRVKGHRHDQSVASILAADLSMDLTYGQGTHFAYVSHKGHLKIADSVCLWSEGL